MMLEYSTNCAEMVNLIVQGNGCCEFKEFIKAEVAQAGFNGYALIEWYIFNTADDGDLREINGKTVDQLNEILGNCRIGAVVTIGFYYSLEGILYKCEMHKVGINAVDYFIQFKLNGNNFLDQMINYLNYISNYVFIRYGYCFSSSYFKFESKGYALGAIEKKNYFLKIFGIRKAKSGDWSERLSTDGVLRNLYPINVINQVHLNARVEEMTLKEFIETKKIGELLPFAGELMIWDLRKTKPSLNRSTRAKLAKLGLVVEKFGVLTNWEID